MKICLCMQVHLSFFQQVNEDISQTFDQYLSIFCFSYFSCSVFFFFLNQVGFSNNSVDVSLITLSTQVTIKVQSIYNNYSSSVINREYTGIGVELQGWLSNSLIEKLYCIYNFGIIFLQNCLFVYIVDTESRCICFFLF